MPRLPHLSLPSYTQGLGRKTASCPLSSLGKLCLPSLCRPSTGKGSFTGVVSQSPPPPPLSPCLWLEMLDRQLCFGGSKGMSTTAVGRRGWDQAQKEFFPPWSHKVNNTSGLVAEICITDDSISE